MRRLDSDSIIVTGDSHVSDDDIRARGVNTVSVQGIRGDVDSAESQVELAELLLELPLLEDVDVDLEILQHKVVHVVEGQVVRG